MNKIIFSFSMLCVVISYTGQSKSSSNIEKIKISNVIDITAGMKNIQTVKLSEIVDSITFIPFETTKASLMSQGGVRSIKFSVEFIFYYEMYFDWNGAHRGSIIAKGQGPLEQPQGLSNLLFKDNHFYNKGSKFLEFDINGKATGKVRNLYASSGLGTNDFLRNARAFFSTGKYLAVYDFPTTLYYLNTDFEVVSSRTVFQADSVPPYLAGLGEGSKHVTFYNDRTLFYNFMNDTVFYVSDTGLEPRWVVKFDSPLRLPNEPLLKINDLLQEMRKHFSGSLENAALFRLTDNKHKVLVCYETESLLFFPMIEILQMAEPRGKKPPVPYIVYFDKNTGKTVRVRGNGFVDDLLGMDYFYPNLGIFNGKMIKIIWPHELNDFIEDCKKNKREVSPQLIALSKKIDVEDNPILILAHVKKKI